MFAIVALAAMPVSGCSTVKKGWNSTKNAVTGLFGGDDKAAPPPDADKPAADAEPADSGASSAPASSAGGLFMSNPNAGKFRSSADPAPALSSVPTEPPKTPTSEPERKRTVEGLVADRQKAEYTEQGGRREPVTVRPLNEGAPAVADAAPPRPQAAPVAAVARLEMTAEGAAAAQAAAARPVDTAAMAQRLDAPPPAPPVATPPGAPPSASAAAAPTAPAPAMTATVASPSVAPVYSVPQPLIPGPSSIVDYGSDTIVVDSSGMKGGSRQLAGIPSAGFDPGNASVSSEVGRVSFASGSATLPERAKVMLGDIARLRAQVDGAIRIVGRGDQAAARASAISRELKRLGVPADRLYDGGADNTQLGDEADIYLDY